MVPLAALVLTASAHAVPAQTGPSAARQVLTTVAAPVRKEAPANPAKLTVYGFLRNDVEHDSSLPDNPVFPLFIRSRSTYVNPTRSLVFSPRATRLGADLAKTKLELLGQSDVSGKVEIDFLNIEAQSIFAESRQVPRIRHAFVRMDWAESYLLAGQSFDVISPLIPTANNITLMWLAGNTGDRRPQLQLGWTPHQDGDGQWSFVGSAGEAGAAENMRDATIALPGSPLQPLQGADTGRPIWQGRVGYATTWHGRKDKLQLGVWGHKSGQQRDLPIAGKRTFDSHSLGFDYQLPAADWLTLRGEYWAGADLGDVRGGVGQSLNPVTGREIESSGGWEELLFHVNKRYTLGFGHSEDHPGMRDVPAGGRIHNGTYTMFHRLRVGSRTELGLDLNRWETHFNGLAPGLDQRVSVFVQQNF
ncbi:MAG: hypothetical protein HY814_08470 [Candidatus Riflebacteria bacterium]|nr:hypothetical protein [Candidatus Riflebacteria bacterium]